MIVEAFLEDFLVQARAVEAGLHGHLNVLLQCLVGGGCPDPRGIESLVKDKSQEERFVVDVDLAVFGVDFAHSRIALHRVDDFSVFVHDFKRHVIKERMSRLPWLGILDGNSQRGAIGLFAFLFCARVRLRVSDSHT